MSVRLMPEIMLSADGPTSPAAPAAAKTDPSASEKPVARPGRVRRVVLVGAVLLALLAGGKYAYDYVIGGWYNVSTDDAYVQADIATISAKVGGFITAFPVAENAVVASDTVIAVIDDGDYKLALEAAQRKVDTQKSTIDRFDSQIAQADAAAAQAQAQVDSADANDKRMEADFMRYSQLVKDKVATPQRLEQAYSDRDQARAAIANAKAALVSAQAAKAVIVAQQKEARRTLDELQVQVEKAARDLSFTEIRAGVSGVFGNKSSSVGALAQPGTRLGALIADGSLYVLANFKETQIHDLKPGQPATIQVDALGGRVLKGTIESFAPGSGSVFSLLPPENATGNFTKIVQRVPVRIALPAGDRTVSALRPGLSVIVTVDTKAGASGGSSVAAN
jgi:membrane fusion protein, multidrug efflux system